MCSMAANNISGAEHSAVLNNVTQQEKAAIKTKKGLVCFLSKLLEKIISC